jgi:hypothetical protein
MESSAWIGLTPILLLVCSFDAPLTMSSGAGSPSRLCSKASGRSGRTDCAGTTPDCFCRHSRDPVVNNTRIPARALAVCTLAIAIVIAAPYRHR